jgi:hypothetical protein
MAWNFVLDLLVASNMGMALQHLGRVAVAGQATCAAAGLLCLTARRRKCALHARHRTV